MPRTTAKKPVGPDQSSVLADLEIDPDALDVECLRHSTLAGRYSRMQADADEKVRRYEERVKVVRSELILKANEDPDKTLGKGISATAPRVEAYYRTHPDHIKVKRILNKAQHEADILRGVVFALVGKKEMLDVLSRLAQIEYFDTPSGGRNLGEASQALKERREATNKRVRKSLNKKGGDDV